MKLLARHPVFAALLLTSAIRAQTTAPEPRITYQPSSGVVKVGESIHWTIDAPADAKLTYRVKLNNLKVIAQGDVPADHTVQVRLDQPGWLLAEFLRDENGKPKVIRTAGAIVAPEGIKPSAPPPEDFDGFWKEQLALLAKVSPNAVMKSEPADKAGVDYAVVTLDNVDGKHVHAQLARPTAGKKFPAMVVYQYAGVYGLAKGWVTGPASEGWLVLNVLPHDLPIDESKAFYEQQDKGPLKNYVAIGCASRDTSYFRTMLLGDYQAIDWLTHRDDWDGKTLIVRGGSQGGLQSIAIAGLFPKVTAIAVGVPAGCDTLGKQAGHQPGWPYWFGQGDTASHDKIMETSRYFDATNFAAHVTCPAIVGLGLRDTTAPAAGIFTMYNQLKGPREVIINPDGVHSSPAPVYEARRGIWMKQQQRDTTSGQ